MDPVIERPVPWVSEERKTVDLQLKSRLRCA
jgi:hypothetical protein